MDVRRSTLDGMAAPATPPARRLRAQRRDLRLVAGVGLVLVSVAAGSRLLGGGEHRTSVWALSGPMSAGMTLSAADLVPVPVALDDPAAYVAADRDVSGTRLLRDVSAGELLPVAAVGDADPAKRRLVTVAVDPLHAPPALSRGERVDVYVSPKDGASVGQDGVSVLPTLVLAGALVADPGHPDDRGVTDQLGVVLDVAAADADRAVAAARGGEVDLVRVGPGA